MAANASLVYSPRAKYELLWILTRNVYVASPACRGMDALMGGNIYKFRVGLVHKLSKNKLLLNLTRGSQLSFPLEIRGKLLLRFFCEDHSFGQQGSCFKMHLGRCRCILPLKIASEGVRCPCNRTLERLTCHDRKNIFVCDHNKIMSLCESFWKLFEYLLTVESTH